MQDLAPLVAAHGDVGGVRSAAFCHAWVQRVAAGCENGGDVCRDRKFVERGDNVLRRAV